MKFLTNYVGRMDMNKSFIFAVCFYMGFALSIGGCSKTEEALGLTKKSPDEFKVLKRAPLSMPPDYALRPPTPGAPRPQEQATAEMAAQTVFGAPQQENVSAPSSSASLLLQQAGADNVDPDIRQKVTSEREELNEVEKSVTQKLMGIGGDDQSASVVNAKEEAERLKKNAEEGRPVTDGETPVIEE